IIDKGWQNNLERGKKKKEKSMTKLTRGRSYGYQLDRMGTNLVVFMWHLMRWGI
ncbi:hypothetical protein ACJX0J_041001, partial [Zea mays]